MVYLSSLFILIEFNEKMSRGEILFYFILQNNSVRYLPGFGPAVPQECSDCGKKFNMGGPIWSAPIHDQEWVASMLADVKSMRDRYPAYNRISAVLTTVSEVYFHLMSKFYALEISRYVMIEMYDMHIFTYCNSLDFQESIKYET